MERMERRMILSIIWVVLGAVLLGLSLAEVLDSSLYAGMGGALMAVGALQVIRKIKYRRDPEYRERVDTAEKDERNRFIRLNSWAWTGYIVVLVECVGVIVAMILGKTQVQMLLAYSVCLILVVYWVSYLILSKKY